MMGSNPDGVFLIALILPAALWSQDRLRYKPKWISGMFRKSKGKRPARNAGNLTDDFRKNVGASKSHRLMELRGLLQS
jgi:hypothetical protein